MKIGALAEEYEHQVSVLQAKINSLTPLLKVYKGEDLFLLRKRIAIYEDMKFDCIRTAALLRGYCDE